MNTDRDDWLDFIETIKKNVRQHAGYFAWLSDRAIEEIGVVQSLHESLEKIGKDFFHSYKSRGAKNDPPDCEALSLKDERIGIEVTELVDSDSISASKREQPIPWEPWTNDELYDLLNNRISKKDKPQDVKGGPYSQYLLIIYCDEPRVLDYELIESIRSRSFGPTKLLSRVFFLMSYSPWEKCCPFIELKINDV
jgi:hypothetical protein